jgi:predicted metal-dependent hydrolase
LKMLEDVGRENDHVPTVRLLIQSILRWTLPSFHPIDEGDTQQALDRLARSPAAQAAVGRH